MFHWKTKNRSGTCPRAPNYQITWEWRYPELHDSYLMYEDMIYATDAERAISKVRKAISEEFQSQRRDVVILECIRIAY